MMDKKKPTLHKKYSFYEMFIVYEDILYVIGCAAITFIIIILFIAACAYFNVSFTDSGMVRNFLNGGV